MKQSNNLLHIKLYIKKVGQLHITRHNARLSLWSLGLRHIAQKDTRRRISKTLYEIPVFHEICLTFHEF